MFLYGCMLGKEVKEEVLTDRRGTSVRHHPAHLEHVDLERGGTGVVGSASPAVSHLRDRSANIAITLHTSPPETNNHAHGWASRCHRGR